MGGGGKRGVRAVISTSSSPHDSRTEMADSMPSNSPNGAAAVVVAGAAAGAVAVAVAVADLGLVGCEGSGGRRGTSRWHVP